VYTLNAVDPQRFQAPAFNPRNYIKCSPGFKGGFHKLSFPLYRYVTGQEHLMEVPSEETIGEIRERYLEYNWHAGSYTWKILRKDEEGGEMSFAELELNKTLADNGVEDETEEFQELGIPSDYFIPVIHLYYTDDLTVA
jgi:hypothetical protein